MIVCTKSAIPPKIFKENSMHLADIKERTHEVEVRREWLIRRARRLRQVYRQRNIILRNYWWFMGSVLGILMVYFWEAFSCIAQSKPLRLHYANFLLGPGMVLVFVLHINFWISDRSFRKQFPDESKLLNK